MTSARSPHATRELDVVLANIAHTLEPWGRRKCASRCRRADIVGINENTDPLPLEGGLTDQFDLLERFSEVPIAVSDKHGLVVVSSERHKLIEKTEAGPARDAVEAVLKTDSGLVFRVVNTHFTAHSMDDEYPHQELRKQLVAKQLDALGSLYYDASEYPTLWMGDFGKLLTKTELTEFPPTTTWLARGALRIGVSQGNSARLALSDLRTTNGKPSDHDFKRVTLTVSPH